MNADAFGRYDPALDGNGHVYQASLLIGEPM
jgi:hypothetical protein